MHCNICDKMLSEKELSYNEDLKAYEPCTECLDASMDAAYSNGFKTEDDEFEFFVEEEFDSPDISFSSVRINFDVQD